MRHLPISIDVIGSITAFPFSWITLSSTLLLPLIFVVSGIVLANGKLRVGYVLALAYFGPFVFYVLAIVEYFFGTHPSVDVSSLQNVSAWPLIGGMVLYGLLAIASAAIAKFGAQYNKSLKADAVNGAA